MRILIGGASGMVGRALRMSLIQRADQTVALVRHLGADSPAPDGQGANISDPDQKDIFWDPYKNPPVANAAALEGFDAAVHLSGENLSEGRWTSRRKAAFRESRVVPTRGLAAMLARCAARPKVLVCASAIGWYGDRGDEILTEESAPGHGFLPDLCRDWERASEEAEGAGIRVVHLRFGVILSKDGGALKKMLPAFNLGLGGQLGSGRQWISWVSLPDAISAICLAVVDPALRGAVNVVAPQPATNSDFTRALATVLHRPAAVPAPAFALRAAFGEMADATILSSTRVLPSRLQGAQFRFQHPNLATALEALLGSRASG